MARQGVPGAGQDMHPLPGTREGGREGEDRLENDVQ